MPNRPPFPPSPDSSGTNLPDLLYRLVRDSFNPAYGEGWSRRQLADALALPTTHCLLIGADGAAAVDDRAVGFALSRRILDEVELLLFAIMPDFRGRGLGGALLTRFIDQSARSGAARIFLEARRDNPATRLYLAHGFSPVGVRQNYYLGCDGAQIDSVSYSLRIAVDT